MARAAPKRPAAQPPVVLRSPVFRETVPLLSYSAARKHPAVLHHPAAASLISRAARNHPVQSLRVVAETLRAHAIPAVPDVEWKGVELELPVTRRKSAR